MQDPCRLRLLVRGRVQGVGFRWFVRETAAKLGLRGWVRNLADGSVEAEAEGSAAALRRLVGALKTGHPYASVESVEESDLAAAGTEKNFDIR